MTDNIERLYEPDKDEGDYFEFITLSGGLGAFDIEDADSWFGRHDSRLDEVVFRTQAGRWVLVYAPVPGHENYGAPIPMGRELTPVEAALWFQINGRQLPEGLTLVVTGSHREPQGEPTRLDREWRPEPIIAVMGPETSRSTPSADDQRGIAGGSATSERWGRKTTIPPAALKAYQSYEQAVEANPSLTLDKEVYSYIKNNN